jgi:O-antigen ligase
MLLLSARAVLLAGPTVLAFFSGGFFTEAQVWAGLVAWLLVAAALVTRAGSGALSRAAWLAIAGVGLLALWTLASMAWAPIVGSAYHAGQMVVLYTGILVAAGLLLGSPSVRVWVEPALALGVLIVIGYGISERLLPGILHFSHSVSAEGRLEQPLTYWNAMGELAALGFVLCAALAGSPHRPRWMGRLAAAACAPLAIGLYLSFSRGALFACLAGLVAVLVAAPIRAQRRGVMLTMVAGGLAVAATAPLHGVTALSGSLSTREEQGAAVLAVLAVVMLGAAATQSRLIGSQDARRPVRLPRRAPWIALALICAGLAVAITVGAKETTVSPSLSGGASRLTSLESDRYAYWDVALRAFASQPLHGVGAGGWELWWLRYRTVPAFAQDAHSLPLQTLAELGLVGLVFLAMLVGGVALGARRAQRVSPRVTTGAIGAIVAYAAHAPLDWDWQMPAVTLVALILAGLVLAAGPPDWSPALEELAATAPRRSEVPLV